MGFEADVHLVRLRVGRHSENRCGGPSVKMTEIELPPSPKALTQLSQHNLMDESATMNVDASGTLSEQPSKRENRVYVGNLAYNVRSEELIEFMRGGGSSLRCVGKPSSVLWNECFIPSMDDA